MPVPKQKHARPGKRAGPVDVHVGSRIRLRRHLLGLSQSELGRALGVTFQQVQKYENGTNRVGASRLHQIALALRTTPAWFFDSLAGPAPAASTSAVRATEAAVMQSRRRPARGGGHGPQLRSGPHHPAAHAPARTNSACH